MRPRLLLALVPAVALLAVSPADAAPRKITRSYTATSTVPDPTPIAPPVPFCGGLLDNAHVTAVRLPAAGTFDVVLSDFVGDWDLVVRDARDGGPYGDSHAQQPIDPPGERITFTVPRATPVEIVACNFTGGPTAQVTWTFTYRK